MLFGDKVGVWRGIVASNKEMIGFFQEKVVRQT